MLGPTQMQICRENTIVHIYESQHKIWRYFSWKRCKEDQIQYFCPTSCHFPYYPLTTSGLLEKEISYFQMLWFLSHSSQRRVKALDLCAMVLWKARLHKRFLLLRPEDGIARVWGYVQAKSTVLYPYGIFEDLFAWMCFYCYHSIHYASLVSQYTLHSQTTLCLKKKRERKGVQGRLRSFFHLLTAKQRGEQSNHIMSYWRVWDFQ